MFLHFLGDHFYNQEAINKVEKTNNKEQPLVAEQKLKLPPAKLTRNHHKRSFFRRRRSSEDVWSATLSATMTTLAAPQQFSTETQPDPTEANAANGTNEAANGAGKFLGLN
jgi:hypothetical protein